MAKYYDEEDELETEDIFSSQPHQSGVDAEALRQAAENRRAEKYGTAGKVVGTVLGAIGAAETGDVSLVQKGYKYGGELGALAGVSKKERMRTQSIMEPS